MGPCLGDVRLLEFDPWVRAHTLPTFPGFHETLEGCAAPPRSGRQGGCHALVGHEPDLGKLAGSLVFGAPRALPLKKAGACAIDFAGPVEAGAGQLAWFMSPKQLRALSRLRRKEKSQ